VAGVPGRPGAAGEVMSWGKWAMPTHTTGHAHTNTQTDKKLEGKVGTVTHTTRRDRRAVQKQLIIL